MYQLKSSQVGHEEKEQKYKYHQKETIKNKGSLCVHETTFASIPSEESCAVLSSVAAAVLCWYYV